MKLPKKPDPFLTPQQEAKSQAKVLPTVFRGGIIKIEWFRKFTFRERLLLIFGHNLVVMIGVACQNNPVTFQPLIIGKCSPYTTPDGAMRAAVETMLKDRRPNHDPKRR